MNVDTCSDVNLLRTYSHLLEDETRALTKRLSELAAENAQLRGEEQANLALEVGMLQEKLARREKELFGDSSERRGGDRKGSDKKRKPREGHGPHEQPELPIVEVVHELDEADCICPNCGGVLDEMADQYEESEEVDVIERRYVIKRHKRKKYSCCTCSSCIDTALGPDKLIEGGRYSLDFAVEVAVAKYADHMPLARQVAQMGRKGLQVTSQTLWDQIHALVAVLKPGYEALRQYVLAALVVGVDEIYELDVDVFSPCAVGGVLNTDTIPRIKARIVCGSANNQLADDDRDARMLHEAGVLYAPDFVVNAGGLISVYTEIHAAPREKAMRDTENIGAALTRIIELAWAEGLQMSTAASRAAEQRIRDLAPLASFQLGPLE